jgi:hypothetical protein
MIRVYGYREGQPVTPATDMLVATAEIPAVRVVFRAVEE